MLTGSRLEQLLIYEAATGEFRWRGGQKKVRPGMLAGSRDKDGYIQICIDQRVYKAHRLAWLWMHGEWPSAEIDHIDLNKANNKISNLREASKSQNMMNQSVRASSATGIKGVQFDKRRGQFTARITANGVIHRLGRFDTADMAASAYRSAAERLHGKFARMQ